MHASPSTEIPELLLDSMNMSSLSEHWAAELDRAELLGVRVTD